MLQTTAHYSWYRSIDLFHRYGSWLTLASFILIPIKLSLALVPIVAIIILYVLATGVRSLPTSIASIPHLSLMVTPLIAFFLVSLLSSAFGIRPWASGTALLSCFFFVLAIPAWYQSSTGRDPRTLMLALLIGQSIAAVHSIVDSAFPGLLPFRLIGTVSESGQLGLTIPMTCALIFSYREEAPRCSLASTTVLFLCMSSALTLSAFAPRLGAPLAVVFFLVVVSLGLAGIIGLRAWKAGYRDLVVGAVLAPCVVTALIANLKRGPWIGAFVGTLLFLALYRRRWILPGLLLIALCTLLEPVQQRLLASRADFFIAGGRSEIWSIGKELAPRFPLGIGFDNSVFLRTFSTEVPPELTHFHSNILNVLVETGWLGLAAFSLWILALFRFCFRGRAPNRWSIMLTGAGCAVLAWQIAGVVEYNFGDSEVLYVAYATIVIAGLSQRYYEHETTIGHPHL